MTDIYKVVRQSKPCAGNVTVEKKVQKFVNVDILNIQTPDYLL